MSRRCAAERTAGTLAASIHSVVLPVCRVRDSGSEVSDAASNRQMEQRGYALVTSREGGCRRRRWAERFRAAHLQRHAVCQYEFQVNRRFF